MKLFIVHVLSTIGTWCCHKAIKVASRGYIKFEVYVPYSQEVYMHQDYQYKKRYNLKYAMAAMILVSLIIFSVLAIVNSIDRAGNQVTKELKREHLQDLEIQYERERLAAYLSL